MTREEKALEASKRFESSLTGKDLVSLSKSDMGFAFQLGIKWADDNPVNAWHDTSEEPKLNQWFLAQIGDGAFDTFIMAMDKNKTWRNWSDGINIKRWAYISELLPKEGVDDNKQA